MTRVYSFSLSPVSSPAEAEHSRTDPTDCARSAVDPTLAVRLGLCSGVLDQAGPLHCPHFKIRIESTRSGSRNLFGTHAAGVRTPVLAQSGGGTLEGSKTSVGHELLVPFRSPLVATTRGSSPGLTFTEKGERLPTS